MTQFNSIDWIATAIVIFGALNLGIIGVGLATGIQDAFSTWNTVNILFGGISDGMLEGLIFILVGLAGLYEIVVGYKFAVSD